MVTCRLTQPLILDFLSTGNAHESSLLDVLFSFRRLDVEAHTVVYHGLRSTKAILALSCLAK